ncbi:hypothetical protein MF1_03750 [Bartonella quintana]|nr:hypothetical protein MF1_03750 [Bartonella quintana]
MVRQKTSHGPDLFMNEEADDKDKDLFTKELSLPTHAKEALITLSGYNQKRSYRLPFYDNSNRK